MVSTDVVQGAVSLLQGPGSTHHGELTKKQPNLVHLSPASPLDALRQSSLQLFLSLLPVSVDLQDVLPHTHSLEWLHVTASLGLCLPEQRQEETRWCLPSSQWVAAFFCWLGFFRESGTLG